MARLSGLAEGSCGVFRGEAANAVGVNATQLARLAHDGVIERLLPNTYRLTAVQISSEQRLRAAFLRAGDRAAVAGRSAAERYGLEAPARRDPRSSCRPASELPLTWNGRTYRYDFAFPARDVILETMVGVGTTPPTTSAIRRSGACPDGTGIGSCSRRGTRCRLVPTSLSASSAAPSPRD
jgi:hypothetical protein